MNAQIEALLMKKHNKQKPKQLMLQDVNRDLIVALLAVPVYGKDARDEEILSIIINSGTMTLRTLVGDIKKEFESKVKAKTLKKGKDGFMRDKEGFIHLKPH